MNSNTFTPDLSLGCLRNLAKRNNINLDEVISEAWLASVSKSNKAIKKQVIKNVRELGLRGKQMAKQDLISDEAWDSIFEAAHSTSDDPESIMMARETLELLENDESVQAWLEELSEIQDREDCSRRHTNRLLAEHHKKGQRIAARLVRGGF